MASKHRIAVALVVPPPLSIEIDGLRRALGDRQLGRIDPHVTIVPPINVRDEELPDALAVVDAAASACPPVAVRLGPVTTFGPDSPVRFLAVDPWDGVVRLHIACWTGVLDRPRDRSFHPHVTVDIDGSPTDGDDPAEPLLADYSVDVTFDRVTVLEHTTEPSPHWTDYLSYRLTG